MMDIWYLPWDLYIFLPIYESAYMIGLQYGDSSWFWTVYRLCDIYLVPRSYGSEYVFSVASQRDRCYSLSLYTFII